MPAASVTTVAPITETVVSFTYATPEPVPDHIKWAKTGVTHWDSTEWAKTPVAA